MAERLTLLHHQRAQASLSTGAAGFGMSSAKARRTSASVGSLVPTSTPPAVVADFSGSLGEKVRRNLPGSELVTSIWKGVRGLRDEGGVTEKEMGEVMPREWRDGAFRPEEISASENSDREVLAAHDAETTYSHKAQKNLESRSTGCGTTGTSHHWTDSPPTRVRRRESAHSGRAKPANAQRPGNGVSQDQELPRGYERGRWTLNASYQPRSSCTQGGDIWGSRSTWRRRVPPVVQRTPTPDMHVCAIVQARR